MYKRKSTSTEKESTKYAKDIINWSALSEKLAGNRDSIRRNRVPEKYKPTINQLVQFVEWWVDQKEMISPDELRQRIENIDLFSTIMGQKEV